MKRDSSSSSQDGPPSKFQRSVSDLSNVAVRFLIPGRAAGIIIGKGGDNIKKIRSQYNVKLNIPDSRGPERIMTIEGDVHSICNIIRDISPKLKDIMNAKLSDPKRIMRNSYGRRRGRNGDHDELDFDGNNEEDEDDCMLDYRILVHESQAGSVIGRGGERIKDLRERYRMRVIKVYQMLAPMSTDRVVQMVADPDSAVQCLRSVIEAVESAPPRGRREDYDAANFSEPDALNYGGWLSREALAALAQGYPLGPPPPPPGPYHQPYPMGPGYMGRGGGGGGGRMHRPRMPPPPSQHRGGPAPVPPPHGRMAPADQYGFGGYDAPPPAPYDNGAGDYGYGGYGGPMRGGASEAPPSGPGMSSRGGTYGGYGMQNAALHDDAKVNQWYGGWS